MRVLVTGIAGFAGSHLADFLLGLKGVEVHGLARRDSQKENIAHIRQRMRLHIADILDARRVKAVIREVKPDRIFHLAGQAGVPASWEDPAGTLRTNLLGTLNVYEAVRQLRFRTLIHDAGSAEEYGQVSARELPIKETCRLAPLSPYGVSKAAEGLLACQYAHAVGLKIVRTRAFNHTGPRQSDAFAASHFAKQVAMIEAGKQKPVMAVGDLRSVRDFTDVRDVVRGYWLALLKGKPGEAYNICSGVGHPIKDILDVYLGATRVRIRIKTDKNLLRRADVSRKIGNAAKLKKATEWKPVFSFETTLLDLLNDWRYRVASW